MTFDLKTDVGNYTVRVAWLSAKTRLLNTADMGARGPFEILIWHNSKHRSPSGESIWQSSRIFNQSYPSKKEAAAAYKTAVRLLAVFMGV